MDAEQPRSAAATSSKSPEPPPLSKRWLVAALPWWSSDLARRRLARERLVRDTVTGDPGPRAGSGSHLAPMLIHRLTRQTKQVVALCPHAHTAGARPGMPLAEATALCGADVILLEWTPESDARALRRLGRWCMRYAPLVMPLPGSIGAVDPCTEPAPAIVIDITGCDRVHGGEARLAAGVLRDLHRRGVHVQVAIAATLRAALAASSAWPCRILPEEPMEAAEALADLPLAALRLPAATLDALREVNVRRIGEAMRLPRRETADRFGAELLAVLDEMRGLRPEPFKPLPWTATLEVHLSFEGPTTRLDSVEQALVTALDRFVAKLARQTRGTRLLEVTLERVQALPVVERIPLGRPSRHARHLWTLLRPRVEKANLGFGVEGVRLRSLIDAPLASSQGAWHGTEESEAQASGSRADRGRVIETSVAEMIDLVSARLGPASVRLAVDEAGDPASWLMHAAATPAAPLLRPTVIFPAALAAEVVADEAPISAAPGARRPIEVRWPGGGGRVREADGPERHSPKWWLRLDARRSPAPDGDRDFWRVRTTDGRWLWLLHRRPDRWSVIGAWA
ncbi:MAG: DNA polymerase Y family protein [Phycisphaeraceae bacterium]|nr:DNA polymerase Y family protein [Phycisphaeraceae bacterium]